MPQTLGVSSSQWPGNQNMQRIQQLTQQLDVHKKQVEESIQQSEQNLAAQYQSMMQAQQVSTGNLTKAVDNCSLSKVQV